MAMRVLVAWMAVMSIAGCGTSVADLNAAVESARACTAGDNCQLEGATACTCPEAINSTQASAIRALASHVTCSSASGDGGTLQCPARANARCQNMRCVADRF